MGNLHMGGRDMCGFAGWVELGMCRASAGYVTPSYVVLLFGLCY